MSYLLTISGVLHQIAFKLIYYIINQIKKYMNSHDQIIWNGNLYRFLTYCKGINFLWHLSDRISNFIGKLESK